MKTILVILDGASEESIRELNDLSPLDYAKTPAIQTIINEGYRTKKIFYPEGRVPDSLCCILTILGVNKNYIPESRAYLEAIAANIKIEEDEVVLRCNLISVENDKLESFNGKGLSHEEVVTLSGNIKSDYGIKFYNLNEYRNILVMKKSKEVLALQNEPPHENIGIGIDNLLIELNKIDLLKKFVDENQFSKNNKQYMFYPWGVSEATILPSYFSLHNKDCSCVCGTEIMKGIAKAMNIDIPTLKNATGDVDTDLREKAEAVLREIKNYDMVIAHINGADEAAHRMDLQGKINFIERIDKDFIKLIHENTKGTKIIILSDHQTSSMTGKHEKGYVDYICNLKEEQNG